MARVRLIHWQPEEAQLKAQALRAAGNHVDYDLRLDSQSFGPPPPDVVVIDLSRRPSHGKEVAAWLRKRKTTRHIPLVFLDGEPEKVALIRAEIPDAIYTTTPHVKVALRIALLSRPVEPVIPEQMMQRYKNRTAAQKLGIKAAARVALVDPPRDYAKVLGDLPLGVQLLEEDDDAPDLTLWFVRDPATLQASLQRMRALTAKTRLWIAWRKQRPGDAPSGVTQQLIRESAREFGLVDYKICALDDTWSAMVFARKTARSKP